MNTAHEAASTSFALRAHPSGNPALGKARRRVACCLGGSNVTNLKTVLSVLSLSAILATSSRPVWANVVNDWDAIASTTIVTNAKFGPGPAIVLFTYPHLAMYDAVNSIAGGFQPYLFSTQPAAGANQDAAAVAAAHDVLVHYFPTQQSALDADEAASLAGISDTSNDISAGVSVGQASAQALIQARANDGLLANVPYTPGNGPGVWQPTPPAFAPAVTPWLGQMTPFTMRAAGQFFPGDGPPNLNSKTWIRDYNQTKSLGEVNSTTRTAAQTEIGLFYTDHAAQQYARALQGLVTQQGLDTAGSARLMAMAWTGGADALIGCFNAKYYYNFWRPVTAIRVGGANDELVGDPNWTPLGITPAHPEYPSSHSCFTGAVADLIAGFFGTDRVHLVLKSLVTQTTHTFDNTNDLVTEVENARIYAGFHYRHSVKDGRTLGGKVADQILKKFFRKVKEPGI
jgi:hypothetical protein